MGLELCEHSNVIPLMWLSRLLITGVSVNAEFALLLLPILVLTAGFRF